MIDDEASVNAGNSVGHFFHRPLPGTDAINGSGLRGEAIWIHIRSNVANYDLHHFLGAWVFDDRLRDKAAPKEEKERHGLAPLRNGLLDAARNARAALIFLFRRHLRLTDNLLLHVPRHGVVVAELHRV